jgi:hypothetical protein
MIIIRAIIPDFAEVQRVSIPISLYTGKIRNAASESIALRRAV